MFNNKIIRVYIRVNIKKKKLYVNGNGSLYYVSSVLGLDNVYI